MTFPKILKIIKRKKTIAFNLSIKTKFEIFRSSVKLIILDYAYNSGKECICFAIVGNIKFEYNFIWKDFLFKY